MRRHRENPDDRLREQAAQDIANHVMAETLSRSYRFSRPEGGSIYAFVLTWTPGAVSLSGDMDELTIVHYTALRTFEAGMNWLVHSNYDYLMSKTSLRQQEFDLDGTVQDIVDMANEEAVYELRDLCARRRRERATKNLDDEECEPEPNFAITRRSPDRWRRRDDGITIWDNVPDGFRLWFKLWQALREGAHDEDRSGPNEIFIAAGRRRIKHALETELAINAHDPMDLIYKLGLSDYYGSYRYPQQTVWQIEALKHGAKMILDAEFPAEIGFGPYTSGFDESV